jgi:lysophospholipase
LRVVYWPAASEVERPATICLFPGRSEAVEKYGRMACVLANAGFNVLAIDWRGQGLSDRLSIDPSAGHVRHFDDYQLDVAALLEFAQHLSVPTPIYLLAHSMGGCIALRHLMDNDSIFKAAAFSAPMWGLKLSPQMIICAHLIWFFTKLLGLSDRAIARSERQPYLISKSFAKNDLTTDPGMWAYMKKQITNHPELAVCGPSYQWVRAAMVECKALSARPSPKIPSYCALGTEEDIIAPNAIELRMENWETGQLRHFGGARHEVMMEAPATQKSFQDAVIAFFK